MYCASSTNIADFQQTTNDTGKTQILTVKTKGKVTMDDVVYADKYPEHYEDIHKNARSV